MRGVASGVDVVIGVDPHRDTLSAAAVGASGELVGQWVVPADAAGYAQLFAAVGCQHAAGGRVWAIEGSGSYGVGLTRFLERHDQQVVEIDRLERRVQRDGAKSDALDAVRIAREARGRERLAAPRGGGPREALRILVVTRAGVVTERTRVVNQLKALIVVAPEPLRAHLRGLSTARQLGRCAALRVPREVDAAARAARLALRLLARRARALETEISLLERELAALVRRHAPCLLTERGIGPVHAGSILIAYGYPGRVPNEAAFARLAGAAPLPASTGQIVRHRLSRGGDRALNRALYLAVLTRLGHDPRTRQYASRRRAEGKSPREIKRCLKRYLARRVYRLLQANPPFQHT
jgi:transposase